MTNNDIIKALECCGKPVDENCCSECPYHCYEEDCHKLLPEAINLINRQKAEIENLKSATNCYRAYEEEQKAEAVKEFVERLKTKKHECGCNFRKKPVFAVTEEKIDETYKEMVGDG